LKKLKLKIQIYNPSNKIKKDTDIYLINTYGKTKTFFKFCDTVFLGGSIIKHGGQNPIEAARFGCKIIHGPNIWNFQEIYQLLNKHGVSYKVNSVSQMTNIVDIIFKRKKNDKNIKIRINNLGNKILNSTLKKLNPLINKNEII